MKIRKIIVFVINNLAGGGAERVTINLAKYLRKAGHQSHIICLEDKIELPVPEDVPVHIFSIGFKFRWLPRKIRHQVLLAPLLDRFIRRNCQEPDLVISCLPPADYIMAFSKLQNVYLSIHSTLSMVMRSTSTKRTDRRLRRHLRYYKRKPCVCVSKGVLEDLRTFFPDRQDLTYIYNPIDADLIQQQGKEKVNEYLGHAIIHVGRFHRSKRQDRLVQAYARSGVNNPLFFIGRIGNNNVYYEQAKNLASSLGVAEKIHFLGFKPNPYAYMARASLLVLSSDYEGLGMVILEAIVLGIPVLSTDCPSGPSEILPKRNLVALDDIDALAYKMKDALANPKDYRVELDDKFTPAVCVQKYLALI